MDAELLAARLRADASALLARRQATERDLAALDALLGAPASASALREARARVSALLQRELSAQIEHVRVARNEQQQRAVGGAELAAVALGGALGALNAWAGAWARAKPASASAATTEGPSVLAGAHDAARAALNVLKQRQRVEHLRVALLSGDPAGCSRVRLCVNGFMTQSDDPARNWRAWSELDEAEAEAEGGTAVFAVEWEAGDAAGWSDFCAHANDGLAGAPVPAVVAHFSGNPWHKAQGKAEQVGVLLARLLAARPVLFQGRHITLTGHSLGGAVVFSAFQELARLRDEQDGDEDAPPHVDCAVSFAGAFIPSAEAMANVARGLAPGGKFLNVFSTRDSVLSRLFWALHLPGNSDPLAAGCHAVPLEDEHKEKLVNVDVSDLIPPTPETHFGHSYGRFMGAILARVASLLGGG